MTLRFHPHFMLCLTLLLSACQTPAPVETPPPQAASALNTPESVPAVRYGRYTLVELVPTGIQRDLQQQIIEVSIPVLPGTPTATVGDALRYVLRDSGYQLCQGSDAITLFDTLPLPAPHRKLGPLTLRDTLQTLTGPAWQLQVDDAARQVCFVPAASVLPGSATVSGRLA
jgi:type IV pili sensor histidine kinase/response regulator